MRSYVGAEILKGRDIGDSLVRHLQRKRDSKGCSDARVAFDGNFSPHKFHKPAGDCQPQADAALLARSGSLSVVRLLIRFEDAIQLVSGDPHAGIFHGDLEEALAGAHSRIDAHPNEAPFRELDGIGSEIDQHLLDSQGISQKGIRHTRHHMTFENNPPFRGITRE